MLPAIAADDKDDWEYEEEYAEDYESNHEDEVDIKVVPLPQLDIGAGEGLHHVTVWVLRE